LSRRNDGEAVHAGRLPSPLLVADLSFREELLIEHYLRNCFSRQIRNNMLKDSEIPSLDSIRDLIASNAALRHSVCALASLTFSNHNPLPSRESLAHLGMALNFLRRRIANDELDEGLLLAIIELVEFEVTVIWNSALTLK